MSQDEVNHETDIWTTEGGACHNSTILDVDEEFTLVTTRGARILHYFQRSTAVAVFPREATLDTVKTWISGYKSGHTEGMRYSKDALQKQLRHALGFE